MAKSLVELDRRVSAVYIPVDRFRPKFFVYLLMVLESSIPTPGHLPTASRLGTRFSRSVFCLTMGMGTAQGSRLRR